MRIIGKDLHLDNYDLNGFDLGGHIASTLLLYYIFAQYQKAIFTILFFVCIHFTINLLFFPSFQHNSTL